MKSTLTRRLRVEGLESRMLLTACLGDGGLALGLAEPIDQTPAIMADQVAELSPGLADAQLPAMETAIAHAQQVDGGLALGLAEPIDQTPVITADQVAELPPGLADARIPAMETAIAHAQQVERPLKMRATSQAVVSLADGSLQATASGWATHLGRYTIEGSGFMNPETGESWDVGVITAANGDQIFYEHESGTVTLTGGTGRFEGATGGFTTVPEIVGYPIVDPIAGTMTMNFIWKAEGTITY